MMLCSVTDEVVHRVAYIARYFSPQYDHITYIKFSAINCFPHDLSMEWSQNNGANLWHHRIRNQFRAV